MKLLLSLLIFSNTLFAQITPFEGKILDQDTKAPVAYAHLSFKNSSIGVSTTEKGVFNLVVETKYLDSKVLISSLSYQDTLVSAKALLNKPFYLKAKTETLEEVVIGEYDPKEVTFGTLKGKKEGMLSKRNTTMVAQFIKNFNKNTKCDYIKNITFTFKENWHSPANVRLRILSKDQNKGTPDQDLLTKNIIIDVFKSQKTYSMDLSEFYIQVPEDGFFIALEKLITPTNMTFIAEIKRSTYPKYVVEHKKDTKFKKKTNTKQEAKLLSFEKYKTEVSHYAPTIDITIKKSKHTDYGAFYLFTNNEWNIFKLEDKTVIMPVQVTLTN